MIIDVDEALKYLGAAGAQDTALRKDVERVARELEERVTPRSAYHDFDCVETAEGFLLPAAGLSLNGGLAKRMLSGCSRVILLCCTLGEAFDALLRAAQARDMARAVMLDACGSAYVEAACSAAEEAIAARHPGQYLTDRFSPGYGDLPLSLQPQLLQALDAPRRVGVTCTDSFLMIPAKSVTAVLGLSDTPRPSRIRGCAFCSMRDHCPYREGGNTCDHP